MANNIEVLIKVVARWRVIDVRIDTGDIEKYNIYRCVKKANHFSSTTEI